jgi:hypothetical protein
MILSTDIDFRYDNLPVLVRQGPSPHPRFARIRSRIIANDRRRFLAATTALGIGTLGLSAGQVRGDEKPKEDKKDQPEEEVGAETSSSW